MKTEDAGRRDLEIGVTRRDGREVDSGSEDDKIRDRGKKKEIDRDRERSHRGSRVIADKPSDEEDDRLESKRKRSDHNNAIALGKTGGVYIPPFKLASMMNDVKDKSSIEYQRLTWDALRKSINGLVNKVNANNIKNIIPELFAENLIRGSGLFCRSCIKSQMASPGFTDVIAALVAVINSKFPQVAELLLKRVVLQLKRAYKRNDKVCFFIFAFQIFISCVSSILISYLYIFLF